MKRIERVIALLLFICCLSVLFPVAVTAVVPENAIEITSVSGQPGEEVSVEIIMRENPGVAYLKLKVDYDPALTLVRAENKGVLSGTFTTSRTTAVKPYVLQSPPDHLHHRQPLYP